MKRIPFILLLIICLLLVPADGGFIPKTLLAANNTGEQIILSGWFTIIWRDGPPGSVNPIIPTYQFTDDSGRITNLFLSEALIHSLGGVLHLNGKRVVVTGKWTRSHQQAQRKDRSELQVETIHADQLDETLVSMETLSEEIGSQPFISILCKFADVSGEPQSLSYYQNMYSNSYPSIYHYWKETSYSSIDLAGSGAVGWYSLPQNKSYYLRDLDGDGDVDLDTDRAVNDCTKIADPDVYFPNYAGMNLIFNDPLNHVSLGGKKTLTLDNVTYQWKVTWLNAKSSQTLFTIAHEMGHSFGLPHSSSMYGPNIFSFWDLMGGNPCPVEDPNYGCLGQHLISHHKDKVGWILPDQKYEAKPGDETTITLERLALPQTNNYKMVQIPIKGSTELFYTVEARKMVGYDTQLPGTAVIIHEVDINRWMEAQVIDADGDGDPNDNGAMWIVGETFHDSENGIRVSVESETETGFVVTISVDKVQQFTNCTSQTQIPEYECDALVDLYHWTNGANWTNNSKWLESGLPCDWYGVRCSDAHVKDISLPDNLLEGNLPSELGNLINLETLDLSVNMISGTIPPGFGNLTNLIYLNISQNKLTGPIPSEMGNLTKLHRLNLFGNRLNGSIPSELGNLRILVGINLSYNQLGGNIPPDLTNLKSLSSAHIGYNKITTSDPVVIDFLEEIDPDWAETQTLPPRRIQLVHETKDSMRLSWVPIDYTGNGGYYEVSYATAQGGTYTVNGTTDNKEASTYLVSNLLPEETYYFIVRTFTPAHDIQQNDLWSDFGYVENIAEALYLPLIVDTP